MMEGKAERGQEEERNSCLTLGGRELSLELRADKFLSLSFDAFNVTFVLTQK